MKALFLLRDVRVNGRTFILEYADALRIAIYCTSTSLVIAWPGKPDSKMERTRPLLPCASLIFPEITLPEGDFQLTFLPADFFASSRVVNPRSSK